MQSLKEPPIVILKANIPLLAGKVPPGWTVSLMDNPGFGEAKEHVVQLAEASMVTSSSYIYLLQTENIGGTEAEEFFKELIRKDKSMLLQKTCNFNEVAVKSINFGSAWYFGIQN